ncbi:hypothetical protein NDU88_005217 [Pleurodeles waltl]|uniref:Uncharacterized protein n=1 Tax=Pleurodeles waltl TaxID=8319 RepID=A0AAV7LWS6_PLEWA|nr:hypothetical protein NDU88_005217 [Pleurodeles waltl]
MLPSQSSRAAKKSPLAWPGLSRRAVRNTSSRGQSHTSLCPRGQRASPHTALTTGEISAGLAPPRLRSDPTADPGPGEQARRSPPPRGRQPRQTTMGPTRGEAHSPASAISAAAPRYRLTGSSKARAPPGHLLSTDLAQSQRLPQSCTGGPRPKQSLRGPPPSKSTLKNAAPSLNVKNRPPAQKSLTK